MKNYSDVTWDDLRESNYISPIVGLNAVCSMQIADYLGVTVKDIAKPRTMAEKELKELGMYTASIKALISRIPSAEATVNCSYSLPLEDGGKITVPCGPIVYYPAGAVARLADEVRRYQSQQASKRMHKKISSTVQCRRIDGSGLKNNTLADSLCAAKTKNTAAQESGEVMPSIHRLMVANTKEQRVVNVADIPMGGGKTSAAIQYINQCDPSEKILFISPYTDEGLRIERECQSKNVAALVKKKGSKLNDLREKVFSGKNIASTHALFAKYTDDVLEAIQKQDYTLIIDEAYEVTETVTHEMRSQFYFMLNQGMVKIDKMSSQVSFRDKEAYELCESVMSKLSKLIQTGAVYYCDNKIIIWIFPVKILNAFKRIIVLTYLFDAQPIYYYLLSNQYSFHQVGVRQIKEGVFEFCEKEYSDGFRYNLREKIHIVQKNSYNKIGDERYALSSGWYKRSVREGNCNLDTIKNKVRNIQKNYFRCSTNDFFWTCFEKFQPVIEDKNIKKRFVECNKRAVNEFGNCHYMAYAIGLYSHPDTYNYFKSIGYTMDTDKWALSEMVQWIWRSAIRNGEDVWIYIPSKEMRNLLINWIEEVSAGAEM